MLSGELLVVRTPVDAAIELLVVREHPDGGSWLIVPVDDFPLIGPADVQVAGDRLIVARCGLGDWVTRAIGLSVGCAPVEAVRQKFADLARGRLPIDTTVCDDPEYQEWMAVVCEFMREI